ncbi:MAG TPA: DUF4159 domain-containing protein [Flavobacteriales bacterium]|nr:DUF4159 domain-containing protein [Flavobacteriales bacterium]
MRRKLIIYSLLILPLLAMSFSPVATVQFAVLKYKGGGDYYANPTSMPNLIEYCNKNLKMNINTEVPFVDADSKDIYNYPFIHMTGHGNVVFSASDAENLRNYCLAGGFLHIDDNYGMDKFVRKEIEKIFPGEKLVELPFNHPIYHAKYDFPKGVPKVHEHDNKPPQGFAIIKEGRVVLFYTYEADLGDGWEDAVVHKDSEETRIKALKMGANLIYYALMGENNPNVK